MSLAIVHTRAKLGINAPAVTVETHLSNGLPAFSIVGLPETAVKESKDRVRSAIINSHFEFPSRRITVNLAPADLPKDGGRYDLPIALGILAASQQIPTDSLANCEFIGELALTGELRPVRGALSAAIACEKKQRQLVVPTANAEEAALCHSLEVLPSRNLLQLCAHLHRRESITPQNKTALPESTRSYPDLADVAGQQQAKRALEVAAAGGHNLIFSGPPGTGKTLLATRLPGILPPLTNNELLEVARIQSSRLSIFNINDLRRPFRNPHHTASAVALVGGGNPPQTGEISLAHQGVLFLDELPEFQRKVLEVLREPLESGKILIARANHQITFPARFQLIAAMNPCNCGYSGDPQRHCNCTPDQIRRYREKISGPLLDRIDLQVTVNRIPAHLMQSSEEEGSAIVRARVTKARQRQLQRQQCNNAALAGSLLKQHCALSKEGQTLLEQASQALHLSPRSYHRVLRVARTIADLADSKAIETLHLQEGLNYRKLDRK